MGPNGGSDGPKVAGLAGLEWRAQWAQSGGPDGPRVAGLSGPKRRRFDHNKKIK